MHYTCLFVPASGAGRPIVFEVTGYNIQALDSSEEFYPRVRTKRIPLVESRNKYTHYSYNQNGLYWLLPESVSSAALASCALIKALNKRANLE